MLGRLAGEGAWDRCWTIAIGRGTVSNQAVAFAPGIVGELLQLGASSFCISGPYLDLTQFQSRLQLAAHASYSNRPLLSQLDRAPRLFKTTLGGAKVCGSQSDIKTHRWVVASGSQSGGFPKGSCSF